MQNCQYMSASVSQNSTGCCFHCFLHVQEEYGNMKSRTNQLTPLDRMSKISGSLNICMVLSQVCSIMFHPKAEATHSKQVSRLLSPWSLESRWARRAERERGARSEEGAIRSSKLACPCVCVCRSGEEKHGKQTNCRMCFFFSHSKKPFLKRL